MEVTYHKAINFFNIKTNRKSVKIIYNYCTKLLPTAFFFYHFCESSCCSESGAFARYKIIKFLNCLKMSYIDMTTLYIGVSVVAILLFFGGITIFLRTARHHQRKLKTGRENSMVEREDLKVKVFLFW